jgi:site-specific DNA-methyltransferase (adenine-specific)
MTYSNQFFRALEIDSESKRSIQDAVHKTGIPRSRLIYYNKKNILPSGEDLSKCIEAYSVSEFQLRLKMGRLDRESIEILQNHAEKIIDFAEVVTNEPIENDYKLKEVFRTKLGKVFQGDCLDVLKTIENDSVDLVFADPPFNLDKLYPSEIDDNLKEEEYLSWTEKWLKECARVLKHGGSMFIWNLPVWNSNTASLLHSLLTFKHWIAVDMKYSLPIRGRLYPSHYSLMYFVKGEKANKFEADRLPTPTCPSCFGNLKDYGGYKHKMNPLGVSLTDVWSDIPPVRHAKYKKRVGANELSVRLLDRVIEMSTNKGDLVLDPFGGSGTTFVVSELKGRRWIGCEIDPCTDILTRFEDLEGDRANLEAIRSSVNGLFTVPVKKERERRGLWTAESVAKDK